MDGTGDIQSSIRAFHLLWNGMDTYLENLSAVSSGGVDESLPCINKLYCAQNLKSENSSLWLFCFSRCDYKNNRFVSRHLIEGIVAIRQDTLSGSYLCSKPEILAGQSLQNVFSEPRSTGIGLHNRGSRSGEFLMLTIITRDFHSLPVYRYSPYYILDLLGGKAIRQC